MPNRDCLLSIVTGETHVSNEWRSEDNDSIGMLSLLTVSPGSLSYYSARILLICDRLSRR
jgi:hypothetical protein